MNKLALTASVLASSMVFANPVFAESINLCSGGVGSGLCKLTIGSVVTSGIQAILVIALVLAFVFLVFGGIKWIMSGGDKAGTEAAKGTITAALIGLVIVFLAWALLNLITTFFNVGSASGGFDLGTVKGN